MATVLIAGGTGLIGMRLSELLTLEGHKVIHLSRHQDLEAEYPAYKWDLHEFKVDAAAVQQADYVINLAGAGIADKPWTENRKKVIIESRTRSNALLLQSFKKTGHMPKAYLAGAAIGIYGDRGEELITEDSPIGKTGFLVESCKAWEAAINEVAASGLRTVGIRIGLVLSEKGGALPKMTMSIPFGLAPYFGNGKQWYSWIHIDDLCRMFMYAIKNEELSGYYNGVGPHPLRNKEMMHAIVKAMGKRAIVAPTPAFALRLGMGELADVVLVGAKISAQKIMDAGFTFLYPQIEEGLKKLLNK